MPFQKGNQLAKDHNGGLRRDSTVELITQLNELIKSADGQKRTKLHRLIRIFDHFVELSDKLDGRVMTHRAFHRMRISFLKRHVIHTNCLNLATSLPPTKSSLHRRWVIRADSYQDLLGCCSIGHPLGVDCPIYRRSRMGRSLMMEPQVVLLNWSSPWLWRDVSVLNRIAVELH
jgi:hypothetical protein